MSSVLVRYIISFVLACGLFLPFSNVARAQDDESGYGAIMSQGIIFAKICDNATAPCKCRDVGDCTLDDGMQIFVNLSIVILAISGSVVLLMFVYGGFLWITAAGNEKTISNGKDTMLHAVIGLAIIIGAYAFVNFIVAGLTGQTPGPTLEDTVNNSINRSGTP